MANNSYPTGTTVFAKLKGYPWWPARIEGEDDLPENVKAKKPKQRPVWPVFFFGSYDYGWFGPNEIKSFDPASAEKAKQALKKGNALKVAISEALDPSLVVARNEAGDSDGSDDEDKEVDRASSPEQKVTPVKTKATGTKKRSAGREQDDSTEFDEPRVDKKRRPSNSEDQDLKRSAVKRSPSVKPTAKVAVQKKKASAEAHTRQDSDTKSIDDNIATTPTSSSLSRKSQDDLENNGEQARAKKKIRTGQPMERLLKLRHKLQKLLLVDGLSDDTLVQNLDRADPVMSEVESFDIDLQLLKDTKIGRLMKKISCMQFSRDTNHIVERSNKLLRQYKAMMDKALENGGAASPRDNVQEATRANTEVAAQQLHSNREGFGSTAAQVKSLGLPPYSGGPAPDAVVAAVTAIVEQNSNDAAVAAAAAIADLGSQTSLSLEPAVVAPVKQKESPGAATA
ncbi:hypothetical protein EMPS_06757 [Entomortierella parvispora]|uniref:PWWP domain-containing protein n=1 Tax=Entomortierella parvispora TaxID=205924 RepID=A0A9P3HD11_9FUNG|nr:hypothetical protein EMPS_06757 [Entomortierella parvispora]